MMALSIGHESTTRVPFSTVLPDGIDDSGAGTSAGAVITFTLTFTEMPLSSSDSLNAPVPGNAPLTGIFVFPLASSVNYVTSVARIEGVPFCNLRILPFAASAGSTATSISELLP